MAINRKGGYKMNIYSYDNYEGDKGVIIADSYDEAIRLYKEEYPKRKIANNDEEYWDCGCYIEEIGMVEKGKLYNTEPWI